MVMLNHHVSWMREVKWRAWYAKAEELDGSAAPKPPITEGPYITADSLELHQIIMCHKYMGYVEVKICLISQALILCTVMKVKKLLSSVASFTLRYFLYYSALLGGEIRQRGEKCSQNTYNPGYPVSKKLCLSCGWHFVPSQLGQRV